MLNQEELLALAVKDLKPKITTLVSFYRGLKQSHAADGLMCAIRREEVNHLIKLDDCIEKLNVWALHPNAKTVGRHITLFETVIDRLTHPSLRTDRGKTPLMLATMGKHEKIVMAMLLCPHVDINAKDNEGKTVFDMALRQKLPSVVDKLLNPTLGPRIDQAIIDKKSASKTGVRFGSYRPESVEAANSRYKPILKHKH